MSDSWIICGTGSVNRQPGLKHLTAQILHVLVRVWNDDETIGSMQVDLVTETDKACEELIFNHLKKHYPDHKVYLMCVCIIKSTLFPFLLGPSGTSWHMIISCCPVHRWRNICCLWYCWANWWAYLDCWSTWWNH